MYLFFKLPTFDRPLASRHRVTRFALTALMTLVAYTPLSSAQESESDPPPAPVRFVEEPGDDAGERFDGADGTDGTTDPASEGDVGSAPAIFEEPSDVPSPSVTAAEVEELRETLFEMEDRLADVERTSALDRFRLTGDYRMLLNSVFYHGPTDNPFDRSPGSPTTRVIDSTSEEIWSHRLRINIVGEPIDSVRVSARLVMYKIFGDADAPPFIQDNSTTRVPRDSGLRLDRAWLDWFITDWLAFSGGRIAYSQGNPAELRENSPVRMGTWGMHMVDGEYDSLNLTLNFSDYIDNGRLRLFYASWFNDSDADPFGSLPFLGSGTDNLRIFGGNIEFSIPGVGQNFVQVGYYNVPDFRPFVVPVPNPSFVPDSTTAYAPPLLNGSLLFPSKLPDSMGSYQNLSALVEFYDIGGSGLDLFAAGALGILAPNGQAIEYAFPDPMTGETMDFPFLFLSSQDADTNLTYLAYLGVRYTIPLEVLNNPRIGFEFNYGSRYMISFAVQQDNLLNKLATRGEAYEAYLIMPVNEHLFFRASYTFIHTAYQGGFFGPNPMVFGSTSPEVDSRIHSLSFLLNASI